MKGRRVRWVISVLLLVAGSCKDDENEQEIDCPTGEVAATECCTSPEGGGNSCSMQCVSACEKDEDCADGEYCDQGKVEGKCVPDSQEFGDDCSIS